MPRRTFPAGLPALRVPASVLLAMVGAAASASAVEDPKPVYDATRFIDDDRVTGRTTDAQETPPEGSTPLLFVEGFRFGVPRGTTRPDPARVRAEVRSWPDDEDRVVMVDIEHLDVENVRRGRGIGEAQIQRNMDSLCVVIDTIREERPGLRIGLFDLVPAQHMHAWDPGDERHNRFMEAFERAFYRINPDTGRREEIGLIDRLDYLAPAMYLGEARLRLYERDKAAGRSFDNNRGVRGIRKWVENTVNAARIANKPIYPVIWHRMHGGRRPDNNGFETRDYIGDELFDLMLTEILDHADGVVWWSDQEKYNPEDPWHAVMAKHLDPESQSSDDDDDPGPKVRRVTQAGNDG